MPVKRGSSGWQRLLNDLYAKPIEYMLTLSKGDSVAFLNYEQKLRNIPLLLLDDFGAEYSKSEWVAAKVESIIIDRYNRMRPIILTTNYSEG